MNSNKIIILDRDGVINQDSDAYIKSPDEWIPLPGSCEAIAALYQAGFTIFVITNQSGIHRGYFDPAMLHKIHEKMTTCVETHGGKIERIYFCPHRPDEQCECRKPKTALYQQLANDYHLSLHQAIMIGDSYRDIEAGQKMGGTCMLVKTGKGLRTLEEHPELLETIKVYDNLADAVHAILVR